MRISLPSHSCSYSVFPEIGRKIRGCIRVCLAFSFYGLSRAQPEMARASKADWVEHMDSRACWYTSCKYDVKQHVECSWLLFLQFVVFSLWHAPCWFFYSWFLGEVTQPFLEPSEGARDRRIRTSAERDKWNGSIFSSLTLTPKLSYSKTPHNSYLARELEDDNRGNRRSVIRLHVFNVFQIVVQTVSDCLLFYSAILEVHKKVVEQRDQYAHDTEQMRRSATPR